jgi:hypothetical protein
MQQNGEKQGGISGNCGPEFLGGISGFVVVQAACPAKLAERSGVSPAQKAGWKPASQRLRK